MRKIRKKHYIRRRSQQHIRSCEWTSIGGSCTRKVVEPLELQIEKPIFLMSGFREEFVNEVKNYKIANRFFFFFLCWRFYHRFFMRMILCNFCLFFEISGPGLCNFNELLVWFRNFNCFLLLGEFLLLFKVFCNES